MLNRNTEPDQEEDALEFSKHPIYQTDSAVKHHFGPRPTTSKEEFLLEEPPLRTVFGGQSNSALSKVYQLPLEESNNLRKPSLTSRRQIPKAEEAAEKKEIEEGEKTD